MNKITRRDVLLATAGIAALAAVPSLARAEGDAGSGLLKQLQASKKIRIGIANNPPYSALNPDGTVTGVAPTITKKILERLGIPEIEATVVGYGQLIPGMQAGRWDFVSAALTINKLRCSQVLFADPLVFDGSALFHKKGASGAPKSLADVIKLNKPLGVKAGGADLATVLAVGVPKDSLIQFDSDQSLLDGVLVGRVEYGLESYPTLRQMLQQRKIEDLEVAYPVPDDLPSGASCVFRNSDTDLHAAYQKELRAMKDNGEFLAILQSYGYDVAPTLMKMTAEQACAAAK